MRACREEKQAEVHESEEYTAKQAHLLYYFIRALMYVLQAPAGTRTYAFLCVPVYVVR